MCVARSSSTNARQQSRSFGLWNPDLQIPKLSLKQLRTAPRRGLNQGAAVEVSVVPARTLDGWQGCAVAGLNIRAMTTRARRESAFSVFFRFQVADFHGFRCLFRVLLLLHFSFSSRFTKGPFRSWLTLREEGQVDLLGRRLTDLARALIYRPPTADVKYWLWETVSGVT